MSPINHRIKKYITYLDNCWVWGGAYTTGGYPVIRHLNKTISVRRYLKPVHKEKFLEYTCPNALCVNPKHLRVISRRQAKMKSL